MRLDFEFTCAFCFCHESEVIDFGAKGTGLFAVEHFEGKKQRPELENTYSNLFYICRFCNNKKLDSPVVSKDGRQLLNPCAVAWAKHFDYGQDFRFSPKSDDARYTESTYVLNEPRKIKCREKRYKVITECLETLKDAPKRIKALRGLLS